MFRRPVPSQEGNEGANGRNASFTKPRRSLSITEARDARRIREAQIKPVTRKRTIAPLDAPYQDSSVASSSKDIHVSSTGLPESENPITLHPVPEKVSESEAEHRSSWWKRLTRRIKPDSDDLRGEEV